MGASFGVCVDICEVNMVLPNGRCPMGVAQRVLEGDRPIEAGRLT